jgi:hypothetical protein
MDEVKSLRNEVINNRKAIEESKWDITSRTLHFKRYPNPATDGIPNQIIATETNLKNIVNTDGYNAGNKLGGKVDNYDYGDGPLFTSSRVLDLKNAPIDKITDN